MNPLPITEISAGGIFAVLVLREVFGFLRARKNGNGKPTLADDIAWYGHNQKTSLIYDILDKRTRAYVEIEKANEKQIGLLGDLLFETKNQTGILQEIKSNGKHR